MFKIMAKDDDADYMIGPVTSKAENMPKKVKEFFKEVRNTRRGCGGISFIGYLNHISDTQIHVRFNGNSIA